MQVDPPVEAVAPLGGLFRLEGLVAVVTGGAGLLGSEHRAALSAAGATAVSLDLRLPREGFGVVADVCDRTDLERALVDILERHGRVDILINNAGHNPQVDGAALTWSRFEALRPQEWAADLDVGLTGAFLACQVFGGHLARQGRGVVVNICSDLAVISPDQRLYRREELAEEEQPVKPVTYSVVKHGLLGLTRYLATYWADRGVRVNALSPGGVQNGQSEEFVARLTQRIPMARMARPNEYHGAVVFLCSEASSYLTGHNLVVDGGRTTW